MPSLLLATLLAQSIVFPAFMSEGKAVSAVVECWQAGGPTKLVEGRAPLTVVLTPGPWTARVRLGPHYQRFERRVEVPAETSADFGPVSFDLAVDLRPLGWHEGAVTPVVRAREFGAFGAATAPGAGASYDALAALRQAGGATFATHRHSGLPFDLVAARLVDGLVITEEPERALALWSLLLDHGYPVTPVADASARMAVQCGTGYSEKCLVDAVKRGQTIVSTGPILAASREGSEIAVEAWARQDQPDRLQRVELWAHNRVLATHPVPAESAQHFAIQLPLTSEWAAVRLVAESGWAITHAFFREPHPAPRPLLTQLRMVFPEIASQQQTGALATIWSGPPDAPGARKLKEIDLERNELSVEAPVTALVRIELVDGRSIDLRPVIASGVLALLQQPPPTDWSLYEEVLRRCRRVVIESRF